MRADDLHAQHARTRDNGLARFARRYPALCTLSLMLTGLGVTVRALLSHDGCSHPLGAVVAMLALAVGGVFALTPLLLLAASDAPWLFPEDSERG